VYSVGDSETTTPRARHSMCVVVQHQIRARERAVVDTAATPQRQPNACHQFRDCERLHHVVIPADGEAVDAIVGAVASAEEDHGNRRTGIAHATQHREAIDVGQHHVEHHQVGSELVQQGERRAPVVGGCGGVALQLQRRLDEEDDVLLVVDHQHALAHSAKSTRCRLEIWFELSVSFL
jgi:hypothetical protein